MSGIEISVKEASKKMRGKNVFLLDVRQPEEFAVSKIEGFLLMPLHELAAGVEELQPHKSKEVLVICHHGARSLFAANFLRKCGFDAKSIKGGIEEWSSKIDPSMPHNAKGPFGVIKV